MAYLHLSSNRWLHQPQQAVEINWGHELLANATDVIYPRNHLLVPAGGTGNSYTPTNQGIVVQGGGSNYGTIRGGPAKIHNHTGDMTITMVATAFDTNSGYIAGFGWSGTTSARGFFTAQSNLRFNLNNQQGGIVVRFCPASGTTFNNSFRAGQAFSSDPVGDDYPLVNVGQSRCISFGLITSSSTDISMYVDGVDRNSIAQRDTVMGISGVTEYAYDGLMGYGVFPRFAGTSSESYTTDTGVTGCDLIVFHNTKISGARQAELTANPWQIFRKNVFRVYFDLGGGGASAEVGPFEITDTFSASASVPLSVPLSPMSVSSGNVQAVSLPLSQALSVISVATAMQIGTTVPVSVPITPAEIAAALSIGTQITVTVPSSVWSAVVSWSMGVEAGGGGATVSLSPAAISVVWSMAVSAPVSVSLSPMAVSLSDAILASLPVNVLLSPMVVTPLVNAGQTLPVSVSTIMSMQVQISVVADAGGVTVLTITKAGLTDRSNLLSLENRSDDFNLIDRG